MNYLFRYNSAALATRARKTSKRPAQPKPTQPSTPPKKWDDSSEDEDESESESEDNETPTAPRVVSKAVLQSRITKTNVFKLFNKYLTTMDGGSRPKSASKDNVGRVGRLLYEIDRHMSDVSLLWEPKALNKIRNTFFEGNSLLAKPRAPTTLKAYITALRLFYTFLGAKKQDLLDIGLLVNKEAQQKITSAQDLLSGWLKSLSTACNLRRIAVRKRDTERPLTLNDIVKIANSEKAKKVRQEMMEFNKKKETSITKVVNINYILFKETVAKFRDHLLVQLLCHVCFLVCHIGCCCLFSSCLSCFSVCCCHVCCCYKVGQN